MQASKTARRVCVANPILPEITAATKFDVGSIDSVVALALSFWSIAFLSPLHY
jgi:hypothetical protein